MKTYLAHNYSDYETLTTDIAADLSENIKLPIAAVHKIAGQCSIVAVSPSISDMSADIILTAELQDKTIKAYSFKILCQKEYLSLSENDMQLLTHYLNLIQDIQTELSAIFMEQARLEREAEKKAKEEANLKAKEDARIKKRLEKLNTLSADDYLGRTLNSSSQYTILGWIARHLKALTPQVPKSMVGWFTHKFGDVENCSVIDDSKKTINGHAIKWNVSFTATFDAKVPNELSSKASKTGKVINDVSFVWGLIDEYGFKFGKEQDIEKIKATIPTTYLSQFKAGYAI